MTTEQAINDINSARASAEVMFEDGYLDRRSISFALTKLDEAVMWINRAASHAADKSDDARD